MYRNDCVCTWQYIHNHVITLYNNITQTILDDKELVVVAPAVRLVELRREVLVCLLIGVLIYVCVDYVCMYVYIYIYIHVYIYIYIIIIIIISSSSRSLSLEVLVDDVALPAGNAPVHSLLLLLLLLLFVLAFVSLVRGSLPGQSSIVVLAQVLLLTKTRTSK